MGVEDEVQATFDEFAAAWSAHDVPRMVACWIEDGNAVDPWGRYAVRHEGIAALLAAEHRDSMAASTYRIVSLNVRAPSDASAIAECEAVIEGARNPGGRSYDLRHRVDAVLVPTAAGWRFLTLHPTPHA